MGYRNGGYKMNLQVNDNGFTLELGVNETYQWANKPNNKWPCSYVNNESLFVEFDKNGLVDLKINDTYNNDYIPNNELNAIVWDHLPKLVRNKFKYLFPNQEVS